LRILLTPLSVPEQAKLPVSTPEEKTIRPSAGFGTRINPNERKRLSWRFPDSPPRKHPEQKESGYDSRKKHGGKLLLIGSRVKRMLRKPCARL